SINTNSPPQLKENTSGIYQSPKLTNVNPSSLPHSVLCIYTNPLTAMQINHTANSLQLKWLGIDTQWEYVVYMKSDCHICISEGFEALTRVQVSVNGKSVIATLNVLHGELLQQGEASLSESAWKALKAKEGDLISFAHLQPVASLSYVRSKMYGNKLSDDEMQSIIQDIADGKYSSIQLSAFITACSGDGLDIYEISGLTKAMVAAGERLTWPEKIVVDKHCVGGLPGNRTTPVVVPIVAAAGLVIPKTSSRAITSPAGTADVMETMTSVNLSLQQIQKIVNKEGGCIAWGGAVDLSPADDLLIKIERALDVDSEGQMIASVLSKKAAAGSTHVVIDIPVGKTAKVRSEIDAHKLKYYFTVVGQVIGLKIEVLITDGSQPVGNGIGPALEALDVLAVLKNEEDAPSDLRERSILIAGAVLDLSGKTKAGEGQNLAREILSSGRAYEKFLAICEAQGGFVRPELSPIREVVKAPQAGRITDIDNRRLAMVAKLCGAPSDPGAGILLHVKLGSEVKAGDPLFTIFTDTKGELHYTLNYLAQQTDILKIEPT
ncbi:MAG: thymidine phosphorylase family protein, partial [Saprospiraceae bacterium]